MLVRSKGTLVLEEVQSTLLVLLRELRNTAALTLPFLEQSERAARHITVLQTAGSYFETAPPVASAVAMTSFEVRVWKPYSCLGRQSLQRRAH